MRGGLGFERKQQPLGMNPKRENEKRFCVAWFGSLLTMSAFCKFSKKDKTYWRKICPRVVEKGEMVRYFGQNLSLSNPKLFKKWNQIIPIKCQIKAAIETSQRPVRKFSNMESTALLFWNEARLFWFGVPEDWNALTDIFMWGIVSSSIPTVIFTVQYPLPSHVFHRSIHVPVAISIAKQLSITQPLRYVPWTWA